MFYEFILRKELAPLITYHSYSLYSLSLTFAEFIREKWILSVGHHVLVIV